MFLKEISSTSSSKYQILCAFDSKSMWALCHATFAVIGTQTSLLVRWSIASCQRQSSMFVIMRRGLNSYAHCSCSKKKSGNLHLLALNCSNDFSRMLLSSKFQVPNPLPCACCQFAIWYWDRNAWADQRGLDMCLRALVFLLPSLCSSSCEVCTYRHIIQSFGTMSIQFSFLVKGYDSFEGIAHVFSHLRRS